MKTQTVRETTAMERAQTERSRLALILPGLLLGMLLAALDQTIVGTAMPRVIAELQGLEHYAWVFTAYMLTSTVTVPLYGKLSDLYGRRTFFLFGMIVFLIGSALSGMAQSMTQLIFFRALQGIGAVHSSRSPSRSSATSSHRPSAVSGKDCSPRFSVSAPSSGRAWEAGSLITGDGDGCSTSTCRSALSLCSRPA